MVTIKFRSFQEYKDYISGLGIANPNRGAPYRFHTLTTQNTVDKIVEIGGAHSIILEYDSPSNEVIQADDPWLKQNLKMNYPASIVVADVTEAM